MRNKYTIDEDVVSIKLAGGFITVVDLKNLPRLLEFDVSWGCMPNSAGKPYVVHKRKKGYDRLHRFILGCNNPELVVDHRDGDSLNNREYNLREVTHQKNSSNRKGANSNNTTTGVRGVTIVSGRYRARVGQTQVGTFGTLDEAKDAVEAHRLKVYGE